MESTTHRQRVSPKRILVVEDDPVVAHMLRTALVVDGHAVELAEDGREGLALFEAGKHDLVITDFTMPGMDGLELAEAIKKHNPTQPVILITAYAEKIGGSMGQVSNIDLLLKKPVSVMDLYNALGKFFPAR